MMSRTFFVAVLFAGAMALGPADASAQNPRNRAVQPRAARGAAQLAPAEVVAMLDSWAVVQAQDALRLTDDQYGPFVTRLRRLQETRRRNQLARNRILQGLRQVASLQVAPPYDEAAIRERLRTLRAHDDRAAAELRRAYDGVDEVIDVAQQARFRIFEESIERRKLDLLMRARQGARRGAGGER
jgi:hypothetical protein